MCARFGLVASAEQIIRSFGVNDLPQLELAYNIAPTEPVLGIVLRGDERKARVFRWGLIPSWAKDPSIGNKLINARAESLPEKPSFKSAFRKRRCLIPATGFYEWRDEGSATAPEQAQGSLFGEPEPRPARSPRPRKQPYFFSLRSGEPLAMAGIWEIWQDEHGQRVPTCSIVTTEPNDLVRPFHDRMPALLEPQDYGLWLGDEEAPERLLPLLAPFPEDLMRVTPVNPAVNSPRYKEPDCLEPAAPMARP